MADPGRILIIQLKRAGDVIMTTPVIETLRTRFPQARIDFLVDAHFSIMLLNSPFLSDILLWNRSQPWKTYIDVRNAHYDWILDFQSSPRSAPLVAFSGAKTRAGYRVPFWGLAYNHRVRRPGRELMSVGKKALFDTMAEFPADVPSRKIFVTEAERAKALALFPEVGSRSWVGFVPPHRHSSRRWPARHFASLALQFEEAGHAVALFCGPGEERRYVETLRATLPAGRSIFVIEPDTLRDFAAALERCKLVVSNDNGPMHLAVAVGRPVVVLFGPTSPTAVLPQDRLHEAVRLEAVSCLECNLNRCPFGHECMELLPPERVWRSCARVLAASHS